MPRINVSDLSPKTEIESIFFVKYIALMEARDGKKYLNVIFGDATGDLEARSWARAEEIEKEFEKGDFAKVKGKINLFQGRKQLILQNIEKVNKEDVDMEDFVMKASVNVDVMFDELFAIVESLSDVYIRDLLKNILSDTEIQRRLKKWQAGKSIHHAYQGGLLEHILSCANLAMTLSKHYKANENYVVCGAILHDICKIYELTDGLSVEYTEEGKLVGHLVKALEIVDRFSYRMKDFPYQMKLHLKHILLSHHGEYAYGSPKIPQSSEAMLVHLIDHMDSKMHSFETIKRADNNQGHWTNYVKHLDRIIFKDELPFYPEYIEEGSKPVKVKTAESKPKNKPRVHEKELKTNLGDALKGFKLKEE